MNKKNSRIDKIENENLHLKEEIYHLKQANDDDEDGNKKIFYSLEKKIKFKLVFRIFQWIQIQVDQNYPNFFLVDEF